MRWDEMMMWAVGEGGRKGGVDCLSVETVLLPLCLSLTQSVSQQWRQAGLEPLGWRPLVDTEVSPPSRPRPGSLSSSGHQETNQLSWASRRKLLVGWDHITSRQMSRCWWWYGRGAGGEIESHSIVVWLCQSWSCYLLCTDRMRSVRPRSTMLNNHQSLLNWLTARH